MVIRTELQLIFMTGKKITIECYKKNSNASIIFTEYDYNGALVDLKIKKLSVESGKQFMESSSCIGTAFKAFIWDMSRLTPCSESYYRRY